MLRAGIAGATGYLGQEALKLLLQHPDLAVSTVTSTTHAGVPVAALVPRLRGHTDLVLQPFSPEVFEGLDAVLLACPAGVAAATVPTLLDLDVRVVDLSGDHRLQGAAAVAAYGREAPAAGTAVYGLPEHARAAIARADLVANPGCYATAAALALLPLAPHVTSVVVDGKSGITGAGREPSRDLHFPEMNEALRAYKVTGHRHEPEMTATLGTPVTFVPHVVPLNRGLFVTCYATVDRVFDQPDLDALYAKAYAEEAFVRTDVDPDVKHVAWTNTCDVRPHARGGLVVVTAALDNLLKGGAGQAVQNLNLVLGLDETAGLGVVA